jgi:uncharacterized protein YuzE
MKVELDGTADTLTVVLRQGPVAQSDEQRGGVILRYDAEGSLLAIEVRDASRRVDEPGQITVSTRGGKSQSQSVIRHHFS